MKWSPTDWLSLRGSYSTSFKAPSLRFAVGTDSEGWVEEIRDPIDPVEFYSNTGTFRTILLGKNPDLEPEESDNYNFGFSFLPELPWGDGNHSLQVDLDYFTFDFENRIQIKPSSQVVTEDPCGPSVVRDTVNLIPNPLLENDPTGNCGSGPVGNVLIVKQSYQNSGGVVISGVDFKAKYSFDIGETNVTIRSQTSMMLDYDIRSTPTSAVMDGVGYTNDGNAGSPVPKTRSNLFGHVNMGNHSVNGAIRYISEMKDDVFGDRSPNVRVVDAHTEVDLQYQYTFGDAQQYNIALGAINIFDKEPPFHRFEGYVLRVHNPFMRQLYARLTISL
ncbi:MAG: TonB-dependent receptor [Gammaproteobacteria bacterium]|nr:TonB-dependent receptor [Gammaproteobacteria bacterium]